MSGKRDRNGPAATPGADRALAAEIEEVLALVKGMPADRASQKARTVMEFLKMLKAKRDLDAQTEPPEGPIDAAEEQRMRDEIMHRLDEIEAEMAAEEAAGTADAAGPEAVPRRLGSLAFTRPDPA